MNKIALAEDMDRKWVYIKEIAVVDLPVELRGQIDDVSSLFSVHNAKGDRLALVGNRRLAFELAHQNDLLPMTVH